MISKFMPSLAALGVTIGVGLLAPAARASSQVGPTTTLTFGDLVNESPIGGWFDGGANPHYSPTYSPMTTGPSYGQTFSANGEELRNGTNGTAPSGGTGKFENNPSGINGPDGKSGVLYFGFSTTTAGYLNDPTGFRTLSFDYSLLNNLSTYTTTVQLWSGLGGTGTELGSLTLTPATVTQACVTRGDEFCTWSTSALQDGGAQAAESAVFIAQDTSASQVEFDDVTISVPEPSTWALMLTGVFGLGAVMRVARRTGLSAA